VIGKNTSQDELTLIPLSQREGLNSPSLAKTRGWGMSSRTQDELTLNPSLKKRGTLPLLFTREGVRG